MPVGAAIGVSAAVGFYSADQQGDAAKDSQKSQKDIANQQLAFAKEQWDYYKKNYAPLESQLISDATTGIKADEGVADRAATDVTQSFATQRDVANRNLARYGLNPNRLADTERSFALGEAATKAGAMTISREGERRRVEDTNFARRTAVAGLGRNIAPNVTANLAGAAATDANAGRFGVINQQMQGQAIYDTSRAIGGLPWNRWSSGQPTAVNPNANSGVYNGEGYDGYNGVNYPRSQYDPDYNPSHYAKGGIVHGPGTGTSDSIPANLSKGEFIIPADVVRKKGLDFFERMVAKDHNYAHGGRVRKLKPRGYADGGKVIELNPTQRETVNKDKLPSAGFNPNLDREYRMDKAEVDAGLTPPAEFARKWGLTMPRAAGGN